MSIQRLFGTVLAASALAGCSDTTTGPETLDAPMPSFDVVGQGQGAVVDHFSDEGLVLLTIDPATGLFAVHYTNSDQVAAFIGCPVPEYQGALKAVRVDIPSEKQHVNGTGETYVIVNDVSGFPANVCDPPLAQGVVRLSLSVNQVPEGSPGSPSASFSSNGVITSADGTPVRLHHSRQTLEAPLGTVSIR